MHNPALIFNLFPRHFDTIDEWTGILPHAAWMGFNHVFVNPFHATGFSGSLYAVKDYYQLNPRFLKNGQDPTDWSPLKDFVAECDKLGMRVVMDLVINHTAIDSVLVKTNPEWFKWDTNGKIFCPFAIDPADDKKVTVWRDLAKIDHAGTSDKEGLRQYTDNIVRFFQDMNIRCFRCDAAYQIPPDFWKHLILSAKERYTDTTFFAETLGCRLHQISALNATGFDYLYNSSKWWHFDAPWCLEQHESNRKIAPSISFPESHDTERLAKENPGTVEIQKSRYVLAAIFSEGLLMPMGYEYGARKKMDVVKGSPAQGAAKPLFDLSDWIAEVHHFKLSMPVLAEEGRWQSLWGYDDDILFMEKQSINGHEPVLVAVNKNIAATETKVIISSFPDKIDAYATVTHPCIAPAEQQPFSGSIALQPGEIVIFTK